MSYLIALAPVAAVLASAQGPPGGYGPFSNIPSCLSSCRDSYPSFNPSDICSSDITTINSCIAASSCSDSDKEDGYEALAQICADAGVTVTAAPEATWSATSGGTAFPTSGSVTSAWDSAASSWSSEYTSGWNGAGGPWGSGSGGWGPFGSSGQWTTDAWTSWWGTSACPGSTWSGWTAGTWSSDAPWTTWSGCTASTTATATVTTTVTSDGTAVVETSTSFGINVADATSTTAGAASTSAASTSTSSAAAAATDVKMAGSAVGLLCAVAGALLL